MLGMGLDDGSITFWQVDYTDAGGDSMNAIVVDGADEGSTEEAGFGSDREGMWTARYRGCTSMLGSAATDPFRHRRFP